MNKTISFDAVVKEMRKELPGRVTSVSYSGLKFALECGIDVWEFAETYTLQAVIKDHGTPDQKQRLKEEIMASRLSTQMYWEQVQRGEIDPDGAPWGEQSETLRKRTRC